MIARAEVRGSGPTPATYPSDHQESGGRVQRFTQRCCISGHVTNGVGGSSSTTIWSNSSYLGCPIFALLRLAFGSFLDELALLLLRLPNGLVRPLGGNALR